MPIGWVNSCNDSLYADMTLTLHKSEVHCLQNSGASCSTIGLCWVTITWQQIFKDALQVTNVVGVLFAACNY